MSGGYHHLDGIVRYRARPGHDLAPYLVDTVLTVTDPETSETETGDVDADDSWRYTLETAATWKAFSMMAELSGSSIDSDDGGSQAPMGWFVLASYFLTGEYRLCKKSTGRYVGVKPLRHYGQGGGRGAWEMAARYGTLDLNDGDVNAGEMDTATLGVNWYLNPAVRIMLNYDDSDVDGAGEAHLVGTRFQVAF